jgi:hypothetical protein
MSALGIERAKWLMETAWGRNRSAAGPSGSCAEKHGSVGLERAPTLGARRTDAVKPADIGGAPLRVFV